VATTLNLTFEDIRFSFSRAIVGQYSSLVWARGKESRLKRGDDILETREQGTE